MRLSFAPSLGLLILLSLGGTLLLPATVVSQEGGLIVVIDDIVADQYDSDGTIRAYVTVRHPQGGAITQLGHEAFTITLGEERYVPVAAEVESAASVSLAVVLELFRTMMKEEMEKIRTEVGETMYHQVRYEQAAALFDEIIAAATLVEFLTLTAYEHLEG